MAFQALEDKNPTSTMKRFKREVAPLQFLREIYINAVEAKAKRLKMYFSSHFTARKLCFADDGCGMSPQQMYEYLCKYNSSSKSTEGGYHDNFGIGVKATTLLNNPYGVVFLSWTPENPGGAMVWLTYDAERDRVGLKPIKGIFESEDGEGDEEVELTTEVGGLHVNVAALDDLKDGCFGGSGNFEGVQWWRLKDEADHIKERGTIVVLLGKSLEDDCSHSVRSLSRYFASRFEYLTTFIQTSFSQHNNPKGLKNAVMSLYEGSDSIRLSNNFRVEVLYFKEMTVRARSVQTYTNYITQAATNGYSTVEYKGELYNAKWGKAEARSWGLVTNELSHRVMIIVRPPHFDGTRGIFPNDKRDRLLWGDVSLESGDRELNLDETKSLFIENHPPRLKELLKESLEKIEISVETKTQEVVDKYKDALKPPVVPKAKKPKVKDESHEFMDRYDELFSGKPQAKIHPDFEPPVKPKRKAARRRKSLESEASAKDLVRADFVPHDHAEVDFTVDGVDYPAILAKSSDLWVVYLNKDHAFFKSVEGYMAKLYGGQSQEHVQAMISREVQNTYATEIEVFAYHLRTQHKRDKAMSGVGINSFITPQALYARLLGTCWTLYPKIERGLTRVLKKR